jgi:hypothetical protein
MIGIRRLRVPGGITRSLDDATGAEELLPGSNLEGALKFQLIQP